MDDDNPLSQPVTNPSSWRDLLKTKKKLLLGLLLFVIILGVVAYLVQRPSPAPPSVAPVLNATADVSISTGGFMSATLQIAVGTQVVWTNNDTQPHQVAADPHPLDNSITGFDSTQILQKGDSYSFTFTKMGTYHYHDHLNPLTLQGTVIVK